MHFPSQLNARNEHLNFRLYLKMTPSNLKVIQLNESLNIMANFSIIHENSEEQYSKILLIVDVSS